GSLNNTISAGVPTLGQAYAEASINASISASSIVGSGSATIYNTGPPDPNGAHSILDVDFQLSAPFTQVVVSYTLDAPEVPGMGGDQNNIAYVNIWDGSAFLLDDTVHHGTPSSSQTGMLNLTAGNYSLTASAQADQSSFETAAAIITATWDLDVQFNTG